MLNFIFVAPSEPISPKVYVTQRKNAALSKLTLAADFRWSEPAQLNGVLSKQIVWYWQSDKPSMKSTTPLPQSARHFILDDLKGNVTYFFQVSLIKNCFVYNSLTDKIDRSLTVTVH
jgi:hypothetical protein